jgi:hypothetical protein
MSFLNDAVDGESEQEASPVPGVGFSAGHEQEEYTANGLLLLGDNRVLSKSVLDLVSSLKSDLENNSVNFGALSGKISGLLNDAAGIEWGSDATGDMLEKLRRDMRLMFMENGETPDAETEILLQAQLKLSLEVQLAANTADTSGEKEHEYALPASDGQNAAIQSQLLQDLNYHPYLRQDASKEVVTAAHSEKNADISVTSENEAGKKTSRRIFERPSRPAGRRQRRQTLERSSQHPGRQ